jgi:transposase
MAKERGKRIPRRSLEDTRRLVVHAVEKGLYPDDAADIFDCGRSTVYGWVKAHQEQGLKAFIVKKAPGPEPKLTERQMTQLRGIIIGRDPRQFELDFALWTRELVREVIKRKFGVEYTVQGVGKILRRLGLSPQRPLVRAYEQDPERVRRWKEEEYPTIHAHAIVAGATIFFCDEAGVRTDDHSGTTWAPVGRTPVVKGTGARLSVNMVSAISAQGKTHFSFLEGNTCAATFIDYLKKLLHDIPGKIFLIVDGHSAHTATATKKFVDSTDGRLTLFYLPPYSPELNPDEWVWKNVKHDHVGKIAARTRDELKNGIEKAIARLQQLPEIVCGFFRDPNLSYLNLKAEQSSSLVSC